MSGEERRDEFPEPRPYRIKSAPRTKPVSSEQEVQDVPDKSFADWHVANAEARRLDSLNANRYHWVVDSLAPRPTREVCLYDESGDLESIDHLEDTRADIQLGNERFRYSPDVRHGVEGFRVARYTLDLMVHGADWIWDESYQFYKTEAEVRAALGREDFQGAGRAAF